MNVPSMRREVTPCASVVRVYKDDLFINADLCHNE